MALIQCKNCGTQLLEKDIASIQEEIPPIICEDCGNEIPLGMDSCPNCGCPIEKNEEAKVNAKTAAIFPAKIKKSVKLGVIIGAFVVLIAIGLLFGINGSHQNSIADSVMAEKDDFENSAVYEQSRQLILDNSPTGNGRDRYTFSYDALTNTVTYTCIAYGTFPSRDYLYIHSTPKDWSELCDTVCETTSLLRELYRNAGYSVNCVDIIKSGKSEILLTCKNGSVVYDCLD